MEIAATTNTTTATIVSWRTVDIATICITYIADATDIPVATIDIPAAATKRVMVS